MRFSTFNTSTQATQYTTQQQPWLMEKNGDARISGGMTVLPYNVYSNNIRVYQSESKKHT